MFNYFVHEQTCQCEAAQREARLRRLAKLNLIRTHNSRSWVRVVRALIVARVAPRIHSLSGMSEHPSSSARYSPDAHPVRPS